MRQIHDAALQSELASRPTVKCAVGRIRAGVALPVPSADLPIILRVRSERRARIHDMIFRTACNLPAVPNVAEVGGEVRRVGGDEDFVARLDFIGVGVVVEPAKIRHGLRAHRRGDIVHAQVRRRGQARWQTPATRRGRAAGRARPEKSSTTVRHGGSRRLLRLLHGLC